MAYVPDPENTILLRTVLEIYRKFDQHSEAVFIAMQLGDVNLIKEIFLSCNDR